MDYILKEGITQQQNGAHVLDVNVGLPEIDEVTINARRNQRNSKCNRPSVTN